MISLLYFHTDSEYPLMIYGIYIVESNNGYKPNNVRIILMTRELTTECLEFHFNR